MALSRIKNWVAEVLTYADLNAEFNNILDNPVSLISPLTGSVNAGGFKFTSYGTTDVPSASSDVPTYGQLNNRTPLSVKDPVYGAVGDGVAVDTTAVQSALDAAYTASRPVYFPAGTYLVAKLTYKGQRLFGDGVGRTTIVGKPSQDIFYAPDPTTGESGSLSTFPEYMSVKDMTIKVDNSTNPLGSFSRVVFPSIGTWGATTAYTANQWIANSASRIYRCVVSGTSAGSGGPVHTSGRTWDNTVLWEYVEEAQLSLGNAAFAFPASDGSASPGNILHPEFVNVRFEVTGTSHANSAVAIFTQRPFYDSRMANVMFRFQKYGLMIVPHTTNFASAEFSPDACGFENCSFFNVFPLITFNGKDWYSSGTQVYASSSGDRSLYLLQYKSLARVTTSGLVFDSFYCEPASATTDQIMCVQGISHVFTGGDLKAAGSPKIAWNADGCTVTRANCSMSNDTLIINGDNNKFLDLINTGYDITVDNRGQGNVVTYGFPTGVSIYGGRSVAAHDLQRSPVFSRSQEFIARGVPSTPYTNDGDLLFSGLELNFSGLARSEYAIDSTLETGGYARLTPSGFAQSSNRVSMTVGKHVPACKCRVMVKVRAASASTETVIVRDQTAASNIATASLTWTTSFSVQSFDVDFSGLDSHTLQFTFNSPSAGAYVDVAWMAFRPYEEETHTNKIRFKDGPLVITGTATPEGAVTAGVGSLFLRTDGGASTTLYVKQSGAGNTGWVAK